MPTVPALTLLSMDPPAAVTDSVAAAAGTRHGLVNVTRLVRSLNKQRLQHVREEMEGSSWIAVQKNWEMVLYARALLDALRSANEGPSSSASTLDELDGMLNKVELHVQATAKHTRAPAPPEGLPLFELPALSIPTAAALLDEEAQIEAEADGHASVPLAAEETEETPLELDVPVASPALSPAPVLSPAITTSASDFNTSGYFAKRAREEAQGGEAGLLPLKVAKKNPELDQEGMRQRLVGSGRGMGASQLHEEIGGQLVDMSTQLKRNALHFANSLEEEKALLQTSQDVLENNLTATKDSKGHLSKVSRKSRGTTCMTIGIMIFVIVLFVWTYMLIRFT